MFKTIATFVIVVFTVGHWVETASGDVVVNVDARANLPPTVPGSSGEAMQFLTAGDYTFTLVNSVAGHSGYHPLAAFTAWSYHTPDPNWGTHYSFAYNDGDSGNNTLSSPPFVGPDRGFGGNFTNSVSPIAAFDATSPSGLSFQIHIPFDQTVGFYIADDVLSDNAGGVSVWIQSAAVPEPTVCGFLGLLGFGLALKRRRHR